MKNIKTRDLIYCALFAALTAIGAFIHFQLFQATITLQFFFTAMAGLLLGARLGALSQLVYVALGLIGIPIFAAGGGFNYIFNPTFGFLLGLIPTTLVSALTGAPVRRDIAMTGEISIRGRVLAIGGLKEKTMAALRHGIKTVIIPAANEKDLEEIDQTVRNALNFITVSHVDSVIETALDLNRRMPEQAAAQEQTPAHTDPMQLPAPKRQRRKPAIRQ